MIEYAVKIDGKYFKDFVYADAEYIRGRYTGHSELTGRVDEGDIIDVVLTDEIERTEVKRSVGNVITTLYWIDKIKAKDIHIVALDR